jgi:hypothetical protein
MCGATLDDAELLPIQCQRVRFLPGIGIPRLNPPAIEKEGQPQAPPCLARQESVEDHGKVLCYVDLQAVEFPKRALTARHLESQDAIESFP